MLAEINAKAARSPAAKQMISPTCSVVSLRAGGQGVCDVDGPVQVYNMTFGMRGPDMRELAKQLGLEAPRLKGITFASDKRKRPSAAAMILA